MWGGKADIQLSRRCHAADRMDKASKVEMPISEATDMVGVGCSVVG